MAWLILVLSILFIEKSALGKLPKKGDLLQVPLLEKIKLSHDTYVFKFSLPEKDDVLGIKVGEHIKIQYPKNIKLYIYIFASQPI